MGGFVAGAGGGFDGSAVAGAEVFGGAAGAAGVARTLIGDGVRDAGAWMPEQVIDPVPFLSRLAARGLKVDFPLA